MAPSESRPPEWEDILAEPFVIAILGSRGSGKTALSHELLDRFRSEERDAYILGFPQERADILPEWLTRLRTDIDREMWPTDSIVLVHEAHHLVHARRSQNAENLELDKLVTVSRQKNSDIVFDTQQARRLDINQVAAVDGIVVRWPALLQEEFERRAVKNIIGDAKDALGEYVTVHDEDGYEYIEFDVDDDGVELIKKHAYVYADQFRGMYPHEIDTPDHWSEGISRVYGDVSDTGAGGDTPDDARIGSKAIGSGVFDPPAHVGVRGADTVTRIHSEGDE